MEHTHKLPIRLIYIFHLKLFGRVLPSGMPGTVSPPKETSRPTVFLSSATYFVKTSVTEASGTFCDVGRQSAACDMASTACHATLRDTLQEMFERVTLRLDVPTRNGTSLKSLIELVNFLDLYESNTVAIPLDSYSWHPPFFSRKSNNRKSLWSIQMVRGDQRMSPSDVVNSAYPRSSEPLVPYRYGASGWGCLGAVWVACEDWSVARRGASQRT